MRNPFKREPDPFAAHRYAGMVRSVRTRHRKHMRHWWHWALLTVFVAIAATSGYFTWLYYHTQGKIQTKIPGVEREEEGRPFNVLLVGSDSREGLTEDEQLRFGANPVGGERADTLILAHVDPDTDHVIMVQFPRDLYVEIPGQSRDRINSALQFGRNRLVQTVERLTGLQINRYAQVNIAGFRDLVDAIGGVEVCVPEPIPFDSKTGLEVPPDEVGMVEFDGERALRFVRSRAFFTGDFQRIQNQQKFLAAAINKVASVGTIVRPDRVRRMLEVAGDNLRTDDKTTIKGLIDMARRFRQFNPEDYEAYIAPNFGVGAAGELSIVVPDYRTMELMFDAIGRNESPAAADGVPAIDPATIRVGVYNGTFQDLRAANAAERLAEATDTGEGGVEVVDIANAGRFNHRGVTVRYRPRAEQMAELVAAAIPGAELDRGRTDGDVDVAVIVGKGRFRTEQITQILPIPIPKPSALPPACR
ncbi:MAG: LCP family protein [Actinomycetota bacterium]